MFEFDFILYVSVPYGVGEKCPNFGAATFRAKIQTFKSLYTTVRV